MCMIHFPHRTIVLAGKPKLSHILDTLIEVANAVAHLHSLNVVHCDLKPENIVLK